MFQPHYSMCACSVTQWCPTLCDPMNCSPPGSSVHGDSPGKNIGVSCHAILQGICPTQEPNLSLLHWQADSLPLCHLGSPLTTPGFCKCFLMCLQELNSHGCTAKVHFIGRFLERQGTLQFLHPFFIPQLQWKHSPKSRTDQCCQSLCYIKQALLRLLGFLLSWSHHSCNFFLLLIS